MLCEPVSRFLFLYSTDRWKDTLFSVTKHSSIISIITMDNSLEDAHHSRPHIVKVQQEQINQFSWTLRQNRYIRTFRPIISVYSSTTWDAVLGTTWTSSSAMAEWPREAWYFFDYPRALFAKSCTKLDFWATLWSIKGNMCALSEIFNTVKRCSTASSRECQFYSQNSELTFLSHSFWGVMGNVCDSSLPRWKADSRLSIGYN